MRLAALILGIISSLMGLLFSFGILAGSSFIIGSNSTAIALISWFLAACFIIGLISACLIMAYPLTMGKIVIAAAVAGLLFGPYLPLVYIMEVLMVIAGIFAIIGAKEVMPKEAQPEPAEEESKGLLGAWLDAGRKGRRL